MEICAAVIGCGNISQYHFSGLEKHGANVKWVCDLNKEAAAPWTEKFNASYTDDYREIMKDDEVNTVVVTLTSRLHKDVCNMAIEAGKHIICEKTLTENAEDSWELVNKAIENDIMFYTAYMKRFIPAVEKAKELIPEIGQIMSTYIRSYQCWGNLWDNKPEKGFFYTPPGGASMVRKNYGGGILVCGGSHILDLILFLIGRPNQLFASMHQPEGYDFDLQTSALMKTANGRVFYEALAHPLKKTGYLRDGWDEKVEINGTKGKLEIYSPVWQDHTAKGSLLVHYDNNSGNSQEYRFDPVSPFDRATNTFCKEIAAGKQECQSPFTGYEVDELIAHIMMSSQRKQAVEISWRDTS